MQYILQRLRATLAVFVIGAGLFLLGTLVSVAFTGPVLRAAAQETVAYAPDYGDAFDMPPPPWVNDLSFFTAALLVIGVLGALVDWDKFWGGSVIDSALKSGKLFDKNKLAKEFNRDTSSLSAEELEKHAERLRHSREKIEADRELQDAKLRRARAQAALDEAEESERKAREKVDRYE